MPVRSSPPDDGVNAGLPSPLFAALTALVSAAIVAALYFAREIVIPITLAVLLSFLLAPTVRWLQRCRLGRVSAVAVVVLVAFIAILGFGGIVVQEISLLAQELPDYRYNLQTKVRSLPGLVPGGQVFRHATELLRDLRGEIAKSEAQPPTPENRP